jgi:uncharacterized protein (DUF1697 family)
MANRRQVALLRGINVGKAKRVAMAELRALVESLGYVDVCTLLNSGNLVFSSPETEPSESARAIEAAVASRLGVASRVIALAAEELDELVAANPLLDRMTDPSRFLVAILADETVSASLEPLLERDWSPDALAVSKRAAYAWTPAGFLESPLAIALGKTLGDRATTRNWATVVKLQALARG